MVAAKEMLSPMGAQPDCNAFGWTNGMTPLGFPGTTPRCTMTPKPHSARSLRAKVVGQS
ncbi:hypothetical protein SAMN05444161_8691 [Rhizobiales bacterium GAS191]|nr:hypothetical protein SAMN05519104_8133 [Rhizobiales bacterium GAS188]SEF12117.1 hypothetical protein SAMN05444161_8691 [Rhizobiales bacterium GAS191]